MQRFILRIFALSVKEAISLFCCPSDKDVKSLKEFFNKALVLAFDISLEIKLCAPSDQIASKIYKSAFSLNL